MILACIRNSLSADIQESCVHASSAREIWESLNDQFDQCNDIIIFQLNMQAFNMRQGDFPLTKYYTSMKRLCEDIVALEPPCKCKCDDKERVLAKSNRDSLIKFLNGLDDQYNIVRNHMLLMDLMSSMIKAYTMLLQVERQKSSNIASKIGTFNVEVKGNYQTKRGIDRIRPQVNKNNFLCDY